MVNLDRLNASIAAIRNGEINKLQLYIKAGVLNDSSAANQLVHAAVRYSRFEILNLLVSLGVDVSDPELIEIAADGDGGRIDVHAGVVKLIMDLTEPPLEYLNAALRFASVQGNVEVIELLLSAGADVNGVDVISGHTPLINAVCNNLPDVAAALLGHGADSLVSIEECEILNQSACDAKTLMQFVASNGSAQMRQVFSKGA